MSEEMSNARLAEIKAIAQRRDYQHEVVLGDCTEHCGACAIDELLAESAELRAELADPFSPHRIAEAVKRANRQRDEAVEAAEAERDEYMAELKQLRQRAESATALLAERDALGKNVARLQQDRKLLIAAENENERLREELAAFHKALPSLQTSSFELGWWKGHEPVPAVSRYTKALLDTTEYGEQLREHYAEPTAAAQHPADGAESDGTDVAEREGAKNGTGAAVGELQCDLGVPTTPDAPEALSGPVSAPTVAPEIYRAFIAAANGCYRKPAHGWFTQRCCYEAGIAAVKEQIAAELRKVTFDCPTHGAVRPNFDPGCISCQRYAALTGAMNIIEGRESFGAKVVREMREAASVVEDGGEEAGERAS